ncbi:MAG: alpha/beta hydrolase [Candidatus Thiodiazotropha sp. (ex Myrtea sp. 'scaly one' KF741663)]|nr:alpha/beta hydrolase [Candidatus Thiodiazotropha sp. (ex Myrtea sp. 'scaly one' KF741663)]
MKEIKISTDSVKGQYGAAVLKKLSGLAVSILLLMWFSGAVQADAAWPGSALSKDGTPISYEIQGSGQTTLVFIHGWSCDARYWRMQRPVFSNKYRVVTLDLAGHGHSGLNRSRYTMRAFGEDVQVVVEATESEQVILIGHSMGGAVIAEAARLMPKRVKGLIGVDTLGNIEYPLTAEEYEQMAAPLKADFKNGSRQFVKPMILPGTDPALEEWILSDMASAPSSVALSAMEEMMSQYISGEAAKIFEEIPVPVISVNADLWPIDYEANRRHMTSYDAIILKGADHFLMMNRPLEFNWALEQAIQTILATVETNPEQATSSELSSD